MLNILYVSGKAAAIWASYEHDVKKQIDFLYLDTNSSHFSLTIINDC